MKGGSARALIESDCLHVFSFHFSDKVKLKTYFQCWSSLNFPEWYSNQPVAGGGVADDDGSDVEVP